VSAGRDIAGLAAGVIAGDRRLLGRAITLVESAREEDRADAAALLAQLLPRTGRAVRLGISGAPGVGKSTFIESFGSWLVAQGRRVAVLAVDPSSQRSGGSILGDKTRMERLSHSDRAFIRPSPAGRTLGGVARRTREAMLVCEAAGYDTVLVETVGVGQSEAAVASMVDMFLLLIAPGGGDDLQGIKRGIVELADLIVVTKADGNLAADAGRIASDYAGALGLLRPSDGRWQPQVVSVSALEDRGMDGVWQAAMRHHDLFMADGERDRCCARQAAAWMWTEVTEEVMDSLRGDRAIADLARSLEDDVIAGRLVPGAAARRLLKAWRRN